MTSNPNDDKYTAEEAAGLDDPEKISAEQDDDLDHAIDEAEENFSEMQAEVSDLKDRLLRSMADAENIRRRAEKDKAEAAKFAITRFSRDLLSVADNFNRALASLTPEMKAEASEAMQTLIVGIEMTERELMTVFERHGVTKVHPEPGSKFDPNFHQAIAEIPNDKYSSGCVVDVTQTGYTIEERLLRPAMVTVSRSGGSAGSSGTGGDASPDEGAGSAEPGQNVNTTA